MVKSPTSGRTLYVAKESFMADVDGVPTMFREGVTLVREGHPILDEFGHMFEPARAHYEVDVEQATAAPGERRAR